MREVREPRLDQRTTIRLGGTALAELCLERVEDCHELTDRLEQLGGRPFFMGAGSNLLAAHDGALPLVLVRPLIMDAPTIVEDRGEQVLVRVGAGVPLARLLRFCMQQSLAGMTGLVGIPGSVGGAIAMNAGSFGVETCRQLHSLHIWRDGRCLDVPAEQIQYGYRHFSPGDETQPFLILSGTFVLTRSQRNVITTELRQNFLQKKSRQPIAAQSAGCVFKNPPRCSAGILLDRAGFKGRSLGGMAFSSQHANFLVNEGQGSAAAAFELIHKAQQAVKERFDIALELEVKVVS